MDPTFLAIMCFSHKNARIVFILKNHLKKTVWSRHLFLFYFKRENKIRKKNPKCDSDKKRQVWEKLSLGPRVRLLIEKVQWKHITPLSP